jgi:CBS domain-containing protein
MAAQQLPGLIISDVAGRAFTVLSGSQVLGVIVPPYVQDDPRLARVYDERASDEVCRHLTHRTVRDLLPDRAHNPTDVPVVDPDATTIEAAAVMARLNSPLVAVVDEGQLIGAITVSWLLRHLLPA